MRLDSRLLADDLYRLLGIPPSATPVEIRRAWRRLALRWHPDRCPDDRRGAEERMKRLNIAVSMLLDPWRRAGYDQARSTSAGVASPTPPPPPRPAPTWQAAPPFAWRWTPSPQEPFSPPPPSRWWDSFSSLVLGIGLVVLVAGLTVPPPQREPSVIPGVGYPHLTFQPASTAWPHASVDFASVRYPDIRGSTVVPVIRPDFAPWRSRFRSAPTSRRAPMPSATPMVPRAASATPTSVKPPNTNKL